MVLNLWKESVSSPEMMMILLWNKTINVLSA